MTHNNKETMKHSIETTVAYMMDLRLIFGCPGSLLGGSWRLLGGFSETYLRPFEGVMDGLEMLWSHQENKNDESWIGVSFLS